MSTNRIRMHLSAALLFVVMTPMVVTAQPDPHAIDLQAGLELLLGDEDSLDDVSLYFGNVILARAAKSSDSTLVPILRQIVNVYVPLRHGWGKEAMFALQEMGALSQEELLQNVNGYEQNIDLAEYSVSFLTRYANRAVYSQLDSLRPAVAEHPEGWGFGGPVGDYEDVLEYYVEDSLYVNGSIRYQVVEVLFEAGNDFTASVGNPFDERPTLDSHSRRTFLTGQALFARQELVTLGRYFPDSVMTYLEEIDDNIDLIGFTPGDSIMEKKVDVVIDFLKESVFPDGYPPPPFIALPAAITVRANVLEERVEPRFDGNSFLVDGNNYLLDGSETDGDVLGIVTDRLDSYDAIVVAVGGNQSDNIIGSSGFTSVEQQAIDVDVESLVDFALSQSGVVEISGVVVGESYGSESAPVVVHASSDITLDDVTGYGLLIVDSELTLTGTTSWTGLVITQGTDTMSAGFVIQGEASVLGVVMIDQSTSEAAKLFVRGNAVVRYSSEAVEQMVSGALSN